MKEKEQYIEDLKDIKDMMNRSSRFISLSGLSGISAGIIALVAAWYAHTILSARGVITYNTTVFTSDLMVKLIGLASITIALALITAIYFTTLKARKTKQALWDVQTKLLLVNLAVPLIAGGLLCVLLLFQGFIGLMAPLTLIFYGLALVNASKYTLNEIKSLGIAEIVLGLISTYFIGYGLFFWALGFGVLHIVYGIIMQLKYGS